jgi:hypothetical protein
MVFDTIKKGKMIMSVQQKTNELSVIEQKKKVFKNSFIF